MRRSTRLGKVGGVEIGAHWSVLVIAALLAYGLFASVLPGSAPGRPTATYAVAAAVIAVAFLVFLLAHEMAHALVARHYGIRVRGITLWLLGGVSELEGEAPTPRAELFIAAAGPLTSLGVGGVMAAAAVWGEAVGINQVPVVGLAWLAGVNVILGVFNLLPGAPLDGGRVVRAIVWWARGDRDAAQIVADRLGIGLGMLLVGLGLFKTLFFGDLSGLWVALLGWFLMSAAAAETAGVRLHLAMADRHVRDIMRTQPVSGPAWQTVEAFIEHVAAESPHRRFPVVDIDGRLTGIVSLAILARVPPEARTTVRLGEIATPASHVLVTTPDAVAADVAASLRQGDRLVPVVEDGRLVGVLTAADLARAVELAALGVAPTAPTAPRP